MEQPTSKDLLGNKHIGDNNADVRRRDSSEVRTFIHFILFSYLYPLFYFNQLHCQSNSMITKTLAFDE
jgi:hypothetical protein